jgi:hypothetical protein
MSHHLCCTLAHGYSFHTHSLRRNSESPNSFRIQSRWGVYNRPYPHTHTHTEKLLSSQNGGRRDLCVFIFFFCGVVCWYNNFVVLFLFLCLAIRPRAATNQPLMKTKDVTDYSGRLIRTSSASQAFWLVIPPRPTHQQFSDDDGGLQMLIAQRRNNI